MGQSPQFRGSDMPPGKECPHCHIIHSPVRNVTKTGPFTREIHWEYPLQCPDCGAQLYRPDMGMIIAPGQDRLQVEEWGSMDVHVSISGSSPEMIYRVLIGMAEGFNQVKPAPATPAPVKKIPPAPVKKAPVKRPQNDWQIPFNTTTQEKEYKRAWYLCKKHGVPYPEAVKLETGEKKTGISRPVPEAPAKIAGSEGLADQLPESNPTRKDRKERNSHSAQDQGRSAADARAKINAAAAVLAAPDPYAIGTPVRETGKNKTHNGIGTIKRAPQMGTERLVEFERGTAWIPIANLELVSQPVAGAPGV